MLAMMAVIVDYTF